MDKKEEFKLVSFSKGTVVRVRTNIYIYIHINEVHLFESLLETANSRHNYSTFYLSGTTG